MTNAFGVGEFLPQGAVSVPHYQSLPVAAPWARQDNTDIIPTDKLPPIPEAGLNQDAVDGRVRAIVDDWAEIGNDDTIPTEKLPDLGIADWAEDGNTDAIPADKLSNGGQASFVSTRIQGTGSAINGFSRGYADFVIPTGSTILGLPEGEYELVALESNQNGVHLFQEATNATTNLKYIRHNLSGTWTAQDAFSQVGGGGGGSAIVESENYVHIGTPNLSSTTETGVVSGADDIKPDNSATLTRFNVRFDNTLPGFNIPSTATYNPANGDIVLPAGHWIICASLNVVMTGGGNSRAQADLSINHGTNQRHSQGVYLRGDGGFFGADAINDSQGKISVTGAVVSDGITPVRIRVAISRQSNPLNIDIRGAHVHGYRQLIGGGGGGGGGSSWSENLLPGPIFRTDANSPRTVEIPELEGATEVWLQHGAAGDQDKETMLVVAPEIGGSGTYRFYTRIAPGTFSNSGNFDEFEFSFPTSTSIRLHTRGQSLDQLRVKY